MTAADHGSASTYTNHNCRCEPCRHAWAEKVRARKAQRHAMRTEVAGRLVAAHLPDSQHGNPNTYSNCGCRCRECTDAWTDSYRVRRERAA